MLLFLAKDLEIATVLSTSFAIIIAIRMTAYYNEDLSKDVAKLLPLVLLGVFLVDPSYFRWNDIIDKINSLPEFFTVCIQFILIIMIIEWILSSYRIPPGALHPLRSRGRVYMKCFQSFSYPDILFHSSQHHKCSLQLLPFLVACIVLITPR